MNNKVRITLYGLGVILFACLGIVVFLILRAAYPYLFSEPSELVVNWLEAPTCKMPCWEKITPGETDLEQAKSFLFGNPKVKTIGKSNIIPDGVMLSVDIQGDYYNPNASIEFDRNNIAQSIKIFTANQNLYLDDIVSYYGFPRYVVIYGQETVGVDVDLLYPGMGLVVNLYSQDAEIRNENDIRFTISPKQEVYGISFFTPNLEYYYSLVWRPLKQYVWKGFTEYP